MNIHDHAGRPVEHIRNQEILGRRKDLGSKTDGLYEALEGVADRLVVIHDGNDRNLVTYVSHGPVIFLSDKQTCPASAEPMLPAYRLVDSATSQCLACSARPPALRSEPPLLSSV